MSDTPGSERKRWERIQEILFEASKKDLADRPDYLNEACSGDEELRKEVEDLLSYEEKANEVFGTSTADLVKILAESLWPEEASTGATGRTPGHLTGRTVGHYHIQELIGAGGMGEVYLAERGDVKKRVSFKSLSKSSISGGDVERLRIESFILAQFETPNIARFIDTGVTEDDIPYVVMEYVDGGHIDKYCDENSLSVRKRLELFLTVCDAVSAAHRASVVHRDLKPSNILVSREGDVRVVDFGIAKQLSGDGLPFSSSVDSDDKSLAEPLVPGSLGQMHSAKQLTLPYASPEQIRRKPAHTSMDVYALGVVLYELLTGAHPYGNQKMKVIEVVRRTLDEAPVPSPSETVVSMDGETKRQVSERRSITPGRLIRQLKGDLDFIALRALAKDPGERYKSVEQLADDIRKYLKDYPVTARPKQSYTYRSWKLLKRHPIEAAVLVILVVAGAVVYQQERATIREGLKAEQVKDFLVEMFTEVNPFLGQGRDVTVRELLDPTVERIETDLSGQPDVQAELYTVMGMAYKGLGIYESALPSLTNGYDIRRQLHRRDHEDVAESIRELGDLAYWQGDFEIADSLHRATLQMRRRLYRSDHVETCESLNDLGMVVSERGFTDEAEQLYRDAIAMCERLPGTERLILAPMGNLAVLYHYERKYDEAEPLYREVLSRRREVHGEEHTEVASALTNLGALLFEKGELDEAEALLRESVAMEKVVLGPDHPDLAPNLSNLAFLLEEKLEYDEAISLYREAIQIQRSGLGDEHTELATTLVNLASTFQKKGDYDEAEPLLREALAIDRKVFGDQHARIAADLNNLGELLKLKKSYVEAESLIREALGMRQAIWPENDHPDVANSLNNLANLLDELGDYEQAVALLQEAIPIYQQTLPEEFAYQYVTNSSLGISRIRIKQNQLEEAEALASEALSVRRDWLESDHWLIADAQIILGASLAAQGQYAEAEVLLLEGYSILEAGRGARDARTLRALDYLIDLYTAWGKPDRVSEYEAVRAG